MDDKSTPIYGWNQPTLGRFAELISFRVGKPKASKIVSRQARRAREVLGQNLLRQVAKAFPHKSRTHGFEQIESDTGIALATIQRISKGQVGASIDTLANIAHNLGCTVADLIAESRMDGLPASTPSQSSLQSLQRRPRKK